MPVVINDGGKKRRERREEKSRRPVEMRHLHFERNNPTRDERRAFSDSCGFVELRIYGESRETYSRRPRDFADLQLRPFEATRGYR